MRLLTSNTVKQARLDGAMVEVLKLNADEISPNEAAWILIQKDGPKFAISGVAKGKAIDASFAPRGFDSAENAIKASVAWADLLEIPIIYVKEDA